MVILKIFLKSPKIFSAGQSFAGEKAPGQQRREPTVSPSGFSNVWKAGQPKAPPFPENSKREGRITPRQAFSGLKRKGAGCFPEARCGGEALSIARSGKRGP